MGTVPKPTGTVPENPDDSSLYYWRTKSGAEEDFVIYGPNSFTAIEVKSSSRVERQDVRSLRSFREEYPEAQAILLNGGPQPLRVNDISCLPCEDFLRNLRPGTELGK
jgi:predicted AAA+ superfamily ATPase